ncbi:MFS transporter [Deinococcus maricopensis]|nr:MFS transporter [Deinococcus maricopensis]
MNRNDIMWLIAATNLLLLIDTSIINVVIPSVARDLHFSAVDQSWIINGYLVAFGGSILMFGRVADFAGRVNVLRAGLIVLLGGSVLGALADHAGVLVAARVVQGLGAAMAGAASFALILALFQGGARQRALGLVAAMAGAGGAIGTVLGGVLTEGFGWRSTFWVSALAAALLMVGVQRLLARVREARDPRPLDGPSAALLLLGQTLLISSLTSLGNAQLSIWQQAGLLGAAAVLLAAFQVRQWRASAPLVPAGTWRKAPLVGALSLAALGQFVLFPMFLLVNLYLQRVLHVTPLLSGLSLLPLCFVVIFTAGTVGALLRRVGVHGTMTLGFTLITGGLAWLACLNVTGSYLTDVLGPTLLLGAGLPLVAITTNIVAGAQTDAGEEGLIAGLLNTAQQLGASAGTAALVALAAAHASTFAQPGAPSALAGGYARALLLSALIAAACTIASAAWTRAARRGAPERPLEADSSAA